MDRVKSKLASYEHKIILLMIDHEVTMLDALILDMKNNGVDTDSVLDICDYLEGELNDLDKVEMFMDILVGRSPDQYLVKN